MPPETSLTNLVDDEFCLTSLTPEEAEIWKEIAHKKQLPNLKLTGVYDAQKLSKGEGVTIAIIDSGVDYNHPELSSRFEGNKGRDLVNNTYDPIDLQGHGTHVAGIIAGKSMGIAPQVKLYALKVMCSHTGIDYEKVNKALEEAIGNHADIINLSLSAIIYNGRCEELCKSANSSGILIVASSGNNCSGAGFPAAYNLPVIGVASVTDSKLHSSKSNIWPTNDICAPGMQILSCYKDGEYCISSGTSMAGAHITGILALAISLLKAKGKQINPAQIEGILKSTAEPLSFDAEIISNNYGLSAELSGSQAIKWIYGAGLVRADRFIEEIKKI